MDLAYWDAMFKDLIRAQVVSSLAHARLVDRYLAQDAMVGPPGVASCEVASAEECPEMPGWTHEELARGWTIAEPPSLGPYEGIARFPYRWAPAAPAHDGGCMT